MKTLSLSGYVVVQLENKEGKKKFVICPPEQEIFIDPDEEWETTCFLSDLIFGSDNIELQSEELS